MLDDDNDPPLAARLSAIAREAKLPICGGNCLGYCNYQAGISVTGYRMRDRQPGSIAFLAQSGSAYGAIADNNDRMPLSLAVSTGRELSVTAADYMERIIRVPWPAVPHSERFQGRVSQGKDTVVDREEPPNGLMPP